MNPQPAQIVHACTFAGWTQREAAARLHVSWRTLQDWERGIAHMPYGLYELLLIKAAYPRLKIPTIPQ